MDYNEIYKWFDKAFESNVPDPIWYREEIFENI